MQASIRQTCAFGLWGYGLSLSSRNITAITGYSTMCFDMFNLTGVQLEDIYLEIDLRQPYDRRWLDVGSDV